MVPGPRGSEAAKPCPYRQHVVHQLEHEIRLLRWEAATPQAAPDEGPRVIGEFKLHLRRRQSVGEGQVDPFGRDSRWVSHLHCAKGSQLLL